MRAKSLGLVWWAAMQIAAAAEAPVPASELLPLEERSRPFLITQGQGEGQRIAVTLQASHGRAGNWLLTVEKIGRLYLIQQPSGEIRITRIELAGEHRRIDYQQPVLLLPAAAAPGERYAMQTTARITDTQDKVVREGRVIHRLDPARRTTFTLPAGAISAYRIEVKQTIQLDLATVTLRLEGGFAQERGLIYADLRYSIDKPLFFGSTTQQTVELAE